MSIDETNIEKSENEKNSNIFRKHLDHYILPKTP